MKMLCRYEDCVNGFMVADEDNPDHQVTCPRCREYLGLPAIPDGRDLRVGVEYGCGDPECDRCYEVPA